MNRSTPALLWAMSILGACGTPLQSGASSNLTSEQLQFFEKRIRPLLVEHCYQCHSAQSEKGFKGGLLLDTRDGLLNGGDSGPALVPGHPGQSLFIRAIRYTDDNLQMPPKNKKLSEEQIETLEEWVRMGAPDPRVANPDAKVFGKIDWESARKHWAFQPIANPPPPKMEDPAGWVASPVDAFILRTLQEKGLEPSPKADRRVLIRRASFHLTGLPPTPEEVDAFANDSSPDAYAKVIDRYLQSERYGERWGRHWLDVARYADTSGDRNNRGDQRYPYAWTYRDYVINAFNQDLPYDQFIVEQLAADRLPPRKDPGFLAALGFLTVGKRFMNNPNEIIDDRIDVVTQGLMGLTVSCARCHDHKFDPIPTKDYYSLHGIFSSSTEPGELPRIAPPKSEADYQDYVKQLAEIEAEVKEFREGELKRVTRTLRSKMDSYLLAAWEAGGRNNRGNSSLAARQHGLDVNMLEFWQGRMSSWQWSHHPVFVPWFAFAQLPAQDFAVRTGSIREELSTGKINGKWVNPLVAQFLQEKEIQSLQDAASAYRELFDAVEEGTHPMLASAEETSGEEEGGEAVPVLPEKIKKYQAEVLSVLVVQQNVMEMDERQVLRLLGNQVRNREIQIRTKAVPLHMNHPGSPPRAMALEDMERPRDSRVLIRGEARNFGPLVPRQFLEILSPAGRQPFRDGSGRAGLAQAIASRQNPLTARVIVNRVWQHHFGEGLVRTPSDFGLRSEPPSHPELLDHLASWFMDQGWSLKKLHRYLMLSSVYQQSSQSNDRALEIDPANQWLWRMNLQRLDFEAIRDSLIFVGGEMDFTRSGPPIPPNEMAGSSRRTIYGLVDRLVLPETYRIFDFANPDMSSAQRYMTTVPQQALFMMNSSLAADQARKLAHRPEVRARNGLPDKIEALFRIAYQRAPTPEEMRFGLEFLESESEEAPGEHVEEELATAEPRRKARSERPARREGEVRGRNAARPLSALERYAQVLLLGNEFVFVN